MLQFFKLLKGHGHGSLATKSRILLSTSISDDLVLADISMVHETARSEPTIKSAGRPGSTAAGMTVHMGLMPECPIEKNF